MMMQLLDPSHLRARHRQRKKIDTAHRRNVFEKMENMSMFSSYYHSPSPFNITLGITYLLTILVGTIGNFLVIFIVHRNKNMHTTTNYLLCNLAAADFMSLVFCPIPMAVYLSRSHVSGHAGQFICKLFTGEFLSQVPKSAAFTALIFLATERYRAIVTPFDTRFKLREDNVGFAIGITWIIAVVVNVPFVALSEFNEVTNRCLHPWTIEKAASEKPYITTVALTFVVVFCLLVYCYAQILRGIYITETVCSGNVAAGEVTQMKAKKKLAVISVSVTVSFCICYAPSVFFQLYLAFAGNEEVKLNYETLYVVHSVVRFILFLASSLNPLFYAFQSSSYRENLKRISILNRSPAVGVVSVNVMPVERAGVLPVIEMSEFP